MKRSILFSALVAAACVIVPTAAAVPIVIGNGGFAIDSTRTAGIGELTGFDIVRFIAINRGTAETASSTLLQLAHADVTMRVSAGRSFKLDFRPVDADTEADANLLGTGQNFNAPTGSYVRFGSSATFNASLIEPAGWNSDPDGNGVPNSQPSQDPAFTTGLTSIHVVASQSAPPTASGAGVGFAVAVIPQGAEWWIEGTLTAESGPAVPFALEFVPEPGALGLIGVATAALFGRRRKRVGSRGRQRASGIRARRSAALPCAIATLTGAALAPRSTAGTPYGPRPTIPVGNGGFSFAYEIIHGTPAFPQLDVFHLYAINNGRAETTGTTKLQSVSATLTYAQWKVPGKFTVDFRDVDDDGVPDANLLGLGQNPASPTGSYVRVGGYFYFNAILITPPNRLSDPDGNGVADHHPQLDPVFTNLTSFRVDGSSWLAPDATGGGALFAVVVAPHGAAFSVAGSFYAEQGGAVGFQPIMVNDPEPASLGLIGVAATLLLARRRADRQPSSGDPLT